MSIGVGQGIGAVLGDATPYPVRLLREATLWLDPRYSVDAEQVVVNQGSGGTALNARYGSTSGVDSNDPKLLPHDGDNYAYITGVVGTDTLSIPDAANLDILGDIELQFDVAFDDWTPGASIDIVNRGTADPNRAWRIRVFTTGLVQFTWYSTGSAASAITLNSAILPLTDLQRARIKITLDVDDGAGNNVCTFFYSLDKGTTWTVSATRTTVGTTSLPAVAATITMAGPAGAIPNAKLYMFKMLNGIGGTAVVDINMDTDISTGAETSFVATSGQTVTVGRSTSGKKLALVTRPVWLFGTDDYMDIADNALLNIGAADSFTVLVVRRAFGTPTSQAIIAKRTTVGGAGGDPGWGIRTAGSSGYLTVNEYDNGATLSSGNSATGTAGSLHAYVAVFNTANITGYLSNTAGTTGARAAGSAANALAMRVGSTSSGGGYADMELVAVAVFRRALTAAEISTICSYFGTI